MFPPVLGPLRLRPLPHRSHLRPRPHHHHPLLRRDRQRHKTGICGGHSTDHLGKVADECQDSGTESWEKESLNATSATLEKKEEDGQNVRVWDLLPWLVLYALLALLPGEI